VLLVWVYYSALILYIGAAITRNWMEYFGSGIKPDEDAATIKVVEMETGRRYKTE
jgi:membrane protein